MEQEKKYTRKYNSDRTPRYIQIGPREFRLGQRIRITNIVDKGEKIADRDLNGLKGTLAPRFERIPFGVIGAYVKMNTPFGTKMVEVNLNLDEFVVIGGE